MCAPFRKYHTMHHRFLGVEGGDPDLPTWTEAKIFSGSVLKLVFLFLQPLTYVFRPLIATPTRVERMEIIQYVAVAITDYLVLQWGGWKALGYLLFSSFLGAGLHPLAAHFVAEHYSWVEGFETYSYYGFLNSITYNVGYHNEHHDFPRIAGFRLGELHKIAPEFYEANKAIGVLYSWPSVMWRFVVDPSFSAFTRIKRRAPKHEPADPASVAN